MLNLLNELERAGVDIETKDFDSDSSSDTGRYSYLGATWGTLDAFDLRIDGELCSFPPSTIRIYRRWFGVLPHFILDHHQNAVRLGIIAGIVCAVLLPYGLMIGMLVAIVGPLVCLFGVCATVKVPTEYASGSSADEAVSAITRWVAARDDSSGAGSEDQLRRDLLAILDRESSPASRFWFSLRLPHTSHSSR